MSFLGHLISSEGVEIDPRKNKAIKNFPSPLTPIDIRSLLALEGYYKMFVDGFASILSLLTTFTQKSMRLYGRRHAKEASKS